MSDLENDVLVLDGDTAAFVIKSDGEMQLYIPMGDDPDNVPEHSQKIAAIAMYWHENEEEILRWYSEHMRH